MLLIRSNNYNMVHFKLFQSWIILRLTVELIPQGSIYFLQIWVNIKITFQHDHTTHIFFFNIWQSNLCIWEGNALTCFYFFSNCRMLELFSLVKRLLHVVYILYIHTFLTGNKKQLSDSVSLHLPHHTHHLLSSWQQVHINVMAV